MVAQETRREAGALSELEAPLGGTGWYDALVTDVLQAAPWSRWRRPTRHRRTLRERRTWRCWCAGCARPAAGRAEECADYLRRLARGGGLDA